MSAGISAQTIREQCAPLFILAPTSRCGTTLMQRLFNSSRQIVIYGEDHYFMQLVRLAYGLHLEARGLDQGWKEAERQNFEFWSNNLLPAPADYAQGATVHVYESILFHDQAAKRLGVSTWGIKLPLAEFDFHAALTAFLPKAKTLFLIRDPRKAAASAKARRFIKDDYDLTRFARLWSANALRYKELAATDSHRVAIVKYEDLLSRPERTFEDLSRFTGIQGFQRSVLSRKINCPGADLEGMSRTGYIDPVALTEEEDATIERVAGKAMSAFGYGSESTRTNPTTPGPRATVSLAESAVA